MGEFRWLSEVEGTLASAASFGKYRGTPRHDHDGWRDLASQFFDSPLKELARFVVVPRRTLLYSCIS